MYAQVKYDSADEMFEIHLDGDIDVCFDRLEWEDEEGGLRGGLAHKVVLTINPSLFRCLAKAVFYELLHEHDDQDYG